MATWAGVTVLASNTMLADAWATALMVLPPEQGKKLALSAGLAVLFILTKAEDVDEWQTFSTPAFLDHLNSAKAPES
jgi:thiamine biosynthesis lipoprotein